MIKWSHSTNTHRRNADENAPPNQDQHVFRTAANRAGSPTVVAALARGQPRGQVIVRDLGARPVPHLTAERFQAFLAKPEARTPEQQAVVDYSDALIDELRRADTIVVGLPMYNFGVPSTLKAYFDHIARAGADVPLHRKGTGRAAHRQEGVSSSPRAAGSMPARRWTTQTAYVRDFLAFLGITDVEFVYAEGLAMGDAKKQVALAKARIVLEKIVNAATANGEPALA